MTTTATRIDTAAEYWRARVEFMTAHPVLVDSFIFIPRVHVSPEVDALITGLIRRADGVRIAPAARELARTLSEREWRDDALYFQDERTPREWAALEQQDGGR